MCNFQALRSHWTLERAAPSVLRSHWALEMTARACFLAAGRSKSLLELAFWSVCAASERALRPLIDRNQCSSMLLFLPRPLSARNHCSSVLRSHLALEITARACFFFLRKHFRACFFFLRKHFRPCLFFLRNPFRNRSASNCALLRAVLCATSQAP